MLAVLLSPKIEEGVGGGGWGTSCSNDEMIVIPFRD